MTSKVNSLYIHFPVCRHLCNYCDFYKVKSDPDKIELSEYHHYLEECLVKQQELFQSVGAEFAPLETLYIGGGTPSLWGKKGSEFLARTLEQFQIPKDPNCEFTLELNPGSWDEVGVESWKSIGCNRLSIGIQSFNSEFLKVINRVHSLEESKSTLEYFHQNDWNFSVDIMLGLPFSKSLNRDVISEIKQIMMYGPKHFSVYILTVGSGYEHFSDLPEESYTCDEYVRVSNFLKDSGFNHYEVSNFSLPGYESLHNKKYWASESVGAVGPSATGFVRSESDGKAVRYKWKVSEPAYTPEYLGPKTLKFESLYLGLRTDIGISLEDYFPPNLQKEVLEKSKFWVESDLAYHNSGRLRLTSAGYLVMDEIVTRLATYL
ncbi:MAG: coproporphyrinogen III oxidase family protein [Bacteriovoracaceae bacterium]|jgi:oxygen-independent coproporphyrinogen III oxidase|nr:coproporphyrinogen III oxidase family protein [Bacteriovoracaceae bacterium]